MDATSCERQAQGSVMSAHDGPELYRFENLLERGELDIDEFDLLVEEGVREPRRLEEGHNELRPLTIRNDARGHGPACLGIVIVVIKDPMAGIRADPELCRAVDEHVPPFGSPMRDTDFMLTTGHCCQLAGRG